MYFYSNSIKPVIRKLVKFIGWICPSLFCSTPRSLTFRQQLASSLEELACRTAQEQKIQQQLQTLTKQLEVTVFPDTLLQAGEEE